MRGDRAVIAVLIVIVTGLAAWVLWPRPAVRIDIAAGGIATVDGQPLPETLFVAARGRQTVIRVVNADTTRHALALFTAEPQSTMDYTISTPGTYGGACSTHPSGNLVYVVR
ncbi:MAG: hypothetical protein ACKN99_08955 [Gemmatimonadota bacterium]|jgi:hypothetical protein